MLQKICPANLYRTSLLVLSLVLPGHIGSAGEVLDWVLSTGVLRIPNNSSWPPYSFLDETGNITGFDIEVADEIARRIGVRLEVLPNPDSLNHTWAEQTSGQWNGAYDAVIGSMTPTAKRDLVLDFHVVYYYAIGSLAVHDDNRTVHVPADASGKRIGVMKAANYELYIRREPFGIVGIEPPKYVIDDPVVVTYDAGTGPYDALEKGDGVELDGFIEDLPVIMRLVEDGRPFKVIGTPLYRVPQAVAIQPGDPEFANLIKQTVDAMREGRARLSVFPSLAHSVGSGPSNDLAAWRRNRYLSSDLKTAKAIHVTRSSRSSFIDSPSSAG